MLEFIKSVVLNFSVVDPNKSLDYLQQTSYLTLLLPILNFTLQTLQSTVQNSALHGRLQDQLEMAPKTIICVPFLSKILILCSSIFNESLLFLTPHMFLAIN
jgi:hypothetical protein